MDDPRAVHGKRYCEVCETLVDAEQWEDSRDHIDEHVQEYLQRTGKTLSSPGAYVWKKVVTELNPGYKWVECPDCGYIPETLQRPDLEVEYCLSCRRRAKEEDQQEQRSETSLGRFC